MFKKYWVHMGWVGTERRRIDESFHVVRFEGMESVIFLTPSLSHHGEREKANERALEDGLPGHRHLSTPPSTLRE